MDAAEEISIVLHGLARRDLNRRASPARRHRREHASPSVEEFLEAGKRRLAGDTARAATTDEVKQLRRERRTLKEVVAEQALESRLLKKARPGMGRPNIVSPHLRSLRSSASSKGTASAGSANVADARDQVVDVLSLVRRFRSGRP